MNESPPQSIESIKREFEDFFTDKQIPHFFCFDSDPTTHGYCYTVTTRFGVGIFSDNNATKTVQMFILKNAAINYAVDEALTDEQFTNYHSCVEIQKKEDFLTILSTQAQPQIR